MSMAGIAQVLRKTQTHVKVLLFRARQVLGRELRAGQAHSLPVGRVAFRPAPDGEARRSLFDGVGSGGRVSGVVELSEAAVSSEPRNARKGPV
jgi:hypothetical protein